MLLIPVLLSLPDAVRLGPAGSGCTTPIIQAKAAYLNVPGVDRARGLLFRRLDFVRLPAEQVVGGAGPNRRRAPDRQDARRQRPGLVVFTFVTTFAFIDWIMSLEPHWFSTMYGAMFLVGQVLESFAFVIALVIVLSQRGRRLTQYVTKQHLHDLGNLMFAFMVLWAYLSFSQFLIIWAGNLPDEIPWYLRRLRGGWGWVALSLVIFHFAVPFVLLLMRGSQASRQPSAQGVRADAGDPRWWTSTGSSSRRSTTSSSRFTGWIS